MPRRRPSRLLAVACALGPPAVLALGDVECDDDEARQELQCYTDKMKATTFPGRGKCVPVAAMDKICEDSCTKAGYKCDLTYGCRARKYCAAPHYATDAPYLPAHLSAPSFRLGRRLQLALALPGWRPELLQLLHRRLREVRL